MGWPNAGSCCQPSLNSVSRRQRSSIEATNGKALRRVKSRAPRLRFPSACLCDGLNLWQSQFMMSQKGLADVQRRRAREHFNSIFGQPPNRQTRQLSINLFSSLTDGTDPMIPPLNMAPSPLRRQAAMTYLRARKMPRGSYRDDLRQLALGLFRLHRLGIRANVQISDRRMLHH